MMMKMTSHGPGQLGVDTPQARNERAHMPVVQSYGVNCGEPSQVAARHIQQTLPQMQHSDC
jgi:hypothetical protein